MPKSTLFSSRSKSRESSYHLQADLPEDHAVVVSQAHSSEAKIAILEENAPQLLETKETPDYKKMCLIMAAYYLNVALQAAFWQMVADWFDNYNDVYTNDSFYKSYSPSDYVLRSVCVGAAQGVIASLFSFAEKRDFKESLKEGASFFFSGLVWQRLADVVPLNTVESGAKEIAINNVIVFAGTAATLFISKVILKAKEVAVFASSMGAVGFALAYPIPVIEPKGIRGSLGGAVCTVVGTVIGEALAKVGLFCYKKASHYLTARPTLSPAENNEAKLTI